MSRVRSLFCKVAAAVLLTGCADTGAPFNDSITESNLSDDLYYLASPEMRGRLVGSPEIATASEWIADRFGTLGLEPAGDDGSYYQNFELAWFSLDAPNLLRVTGSGRARQPGDGWTPINFSASTSAAGLVAFAGFGIVEPRLGYDDYRDEDVRGKFVLVLEREPGVTDPSSPFDGVVTAEASRTWRKALSAQERGAIGILFVRDVHNRPETGDWQQAHASSWPEEPRRVERFLLGAWVEDITIPAAQISVELAEVLVSGSGSTLEELSMASEEAGEGLGVIALPGAEASLTVNVERHTVMGRNVLAMVEGSDPDLRDEVVIIGAHHDHDGTDGETVFPGADDDGSGTVGVMGVAGAYARAIEAGERPRRSVIFAIWDAEERGLLGAWYYTLRPLFPLQSTVAKLNLDMIGRHQEVPEDGAGRFRGLEVQSAESNSNATNILGYSRTPDLAGQIEAANTFGLELKMRYDNNESNLLRRSDHWPFLQNGVPAVWFHTGLHPDYHRAGDTPDRIEYEKMTRIVRLVHQTSWNLAQGDTRPSLQEMGSRPRS
ncbi:MAG: M28 family peptidase [bacterium]|nr:M28 family peptidase [Gemmatimonadota bacterium]HIL90043.1 M28 family peptidase [Gemmatimonadota bacterium]